MAQVFFVQTFNATRLTIRDTGEMNMIRAPPRSPSIEAHPGLRQHKLIYVRTGTSERLNPTLPSQFLSLFIDYPPIKFEIC